MFEGLIDDSYYSRYGFDRSDRRYPDVEIVTPPAPILTDAQLLRFTRTDLIEGNDPDTVQRNLDTITELQDFAAAAQMHIDGPDGCLDRCVAKQTLRARIPMSSNIANGITLPYGPVISIKEISYINSVGTKVVFAPTEYVLENKKYLRTFFNLNWPAPTLSIEYDAGYVPVPAPIVQAIKLLVGHFNEHRMAVNELGNMQVLPLGVASLIQPFRCFM